MINQNLGIIERIIRLLLCGVLTIWLFSQNQFGPLEWLLTVCAIFLSLNTLFARCYLWHLLGINTCSDDMNNCNKVHCD
ncbi:DUF2892 domain-containing protein [Oceanicoccus sp. KOV_DT_Chl]|uniref:YgaP family membrane protein n=1 Tax=Oceanicoccus sp. KOV_DT_Chl TaxID=1904639 RepID=UPI000C7E48C9